MSRLWYLLHGIQELVDEEMEGVKKGMEHERGEILSGQLGKRDDGKNRYINL